MPLTHLRKARRPLKPTNSRGRKPSRARDEALQTQMEEAFSASYETGIRRIKANVSTQKMANAYYGKDYAGVMIDVPFEDFNSALTEAITELHTATKEGGVRAARMVPNLEELDYSLNNPRIKDYLETRTGALISGVRDDFQLSVQEMIASRFASGTTTSKLTQDIGEQLRATIGLDRISSGALKNANASGKYDKAGLKALEDRLFARRAERIARTEVSYAMNEGQLAVWSASEEQGLIPEGADKVWIAEANPCQELCRPMDGIAVGLNEDFLLPDGVTIASPPAHPNCRCIMQLQHPDLDEVPGSNVQNYNPDDL